MGKRRSRRHFRYAAMYYYPRELDKLAIDSHFFDDTGTLRKSSTKQKLRNRHSTDKQFVSNRISKVREKNFIFPLDRIDLLQSAHFNNVTQVSKR